MIQLSSCAFKPMLHGVPRTSQLNICPDARFIFYFLTPPNVGDNKLHGSFIVFVTGAFIV